MRVLLVGINYAPDLIGVAKYTTELCENLAADGHEVQVITAPPYYPAWQVPPDYKAAYFRERHENGVSLTRVPIFVPGKPSGAKRLVHHASFALTSAGPVLAKAMMWRPDLMISVAPSLMSAAFVAFAARIVGIKSWLHLQDFEVDAAFDLGLLRNPRLRKIMLWVEKRTLKSFDCVSTISPRMLSRLEAKGLNPDKLREVRNWVDTNSIISIDRDTRFRRELRLKKTDAIGLYSGTMSNKQGLDLIVEAAALLEKSHPHIHFVLCGDGPHKPRLMTQSSGRPNVHFLGLQPNEFFNELLATADFHLLPQKAEAADLVLPSKLAGVFSSGRPVIAMAGPDTGLAAEVMGAGLVITPGDSQALASAVCQLSEDEVLSRSLGSNARTRAVERWDRQAILSYWTREMFEISGQSDSAQTANQAA
jgi:colanic acid biosynthesis glycosyl transferase WcaI